jgi:hypothetical protein
MSMADDEIGLGPTPERLARGPVELLERAQDEEGRVSRPHRAIDILAAMERRGAITPGMRRAGEDFRALFQRAQLDPLAAADISRPVVSGRGFVNAPGWRIENARRHLYDAILAVGGYSSPAGSCLFHVLGWEQTLKEWAFGQGWSGRRVSQEAASGILIGTLGALEAFFEKNSLTN